MIEEPKRIQIKATRQRPLSSTIASFQGAASSVASDALWGQGALAPDIAPLLPGMQAAGPALTVTCRPGDLLGLLAALKFIQPDDIIVCATQGHRAHATAGDRVCGMMKNAGAAAFVTDGTLRDAAGIEETRLPVWATGLTPASPVSNGPGRVGFPIELGGQRIETGDMIVADRDGVTVVPYAKAEATATRMQEILSLETALDQRVRDGLVLPDEIDALLNSDETQFLE